MPRMPARRLVRRLSLEQLERREVLSVTFIDAGPPFAGEQYYLDVQFGDLDGDGHIDAVVRQRSNDDGLAVRCWINDGRGVFAPGQTLAPGQAFLNEDYMVNRIALGDVEGDGDLDVVVHYYRTWPDLYQEVRLYTNNGGADFTAAALISGDPNVNSWFWLVDIDRDGDLALVDAQTSIWTNGNDGKLHYSSRMDDKANSGYWSLFFEDVDGDGDTDAITGDDTRRLLRDVGDSYEREDLDIPASVRTIGDVDGDGDVDLVVGASAAHHFLFLNDGLANFTPATDRAPQSDPSVLIQSAALGDIDGDGDLDLAVGLVTERGDRVISELWFNNGNAVFEDRVEIPGPGWVIDLADVEGDGDLDVLTSDTLWLTEVRPFDPGDANRDGEFNQLDIVQVLVSAKYLSGESATWEEGDWNGDGVFAQGDVVAALATGNYLQGPYADAALAKLAD